jgi:hemerythrin superfamily protein
LAFLERCLKTISAAGLMVVHRLFLNRNQKLRGRVHALTVRVAIQNMGAVMPTKSRRKAAKRGAKSPRDAIALLRADHMKVTELFDQFEKAREDSRKQKLASEICNELKVHTTIEEEIFYPTVRGVLLKEHDLLDEAFVEHSSAKELIAQIEAGAPQDDKWEAKVMVLSEYIKHHVKEEQNELFPKVRKTKLDLRELGQRLAMRKKQLMGAMEPSRRDKRGDRGAVESQI